MQIDLDGFNRLCVLFILLFIFLFVRFLVAWLCVGRLFVVLLLIFPFVGGFFLVALGFERGSFIRLQRDCENAVG